MEDQEFVLHSKMICALSFLPPDDVEEGFEQLSDVILEAYNDHMDNLLEYFEDTYIGRYRRNAPRRPRCSLSTFGICSIEHTMSYPEPTLV